jgi:hypothetical protein
VLAAFHGVSLLSERLPAILSHRSPEAILLRISTSIRFGGLPVSHEGAQHRLGLSQHRAQSKTTGSGQRPASWCWCWCFFQRVAGFDSLLPAKGGAFGAPTRRPSGSGGSSQLSQQPAASSQQPAASSSSSPQPAAAAAAPAPSRPEVKSASKKAVCGAGRWGRGWVGLFKNEKRPSRRGAGHHGRRCRRWFETRRASAGGGGAGEPP